MMIVVERGKAAKVLSDSGEDIRVLLAKHRVYVEAIHLVCSAGGTSIKCDLISDNFIVETPTDLVQVLEVLNTLEQPE